MSLWRDRRIAFLVAGQSLNAIGTWCALVAIWGYATFHFDAGPSEIALLGLAWALPPFLLGPIAGIPVDRFGPKRALIVADGAAAIVALLFLFAGSFEALVILAAIDGVTKSFAQPAFQALPPRLVADDQLATANAMLATAEQSAIAFGPLLASVSIALFGFVGAFVVNSITFVVGIAVLLPFRIGPVPRREGDAPASGVIHEIREGVRVIATRPELRRLMLLAMCCYLIWARPRCSRCCRRRSGSPCSPPGWS
jgi:MFS family permease